MPEFNFLYSGNQQQDLHNIAVYIDSFCAAIGMPNVEIDTRALWGVLTSLAQDFPYRQGVEKASPFKKAAAFTTDFIAAKPILTPFPQEHFGDVAGCQNAIIAYELSVDALHGAEINCQIRGRTIKLTERIKVSRHYWMDLISALSACTRVHHYDLLTLVYESLAYRWNPDASYPPII